MELLHSSDIVSLLMASPPRVRVAHKRSGASSGLLLAFAPHRPTPALIRHRLRTCAAALHSPGVRARFNWLPFARFQPGHGPTAASTLVISGDDDTAERTARPPPEVIVIDDSSSDDDNAAAIAKERTKPRRVRWRGSARAMAALVAVASIEYEAMRRRQRQASVL